MEIVITFIENFKEMFVSMAFYIMLGLLFVGILNTYIKKESVLKHLGKEKFSSVVKASVVGVPLPLCSCGVVPTAVELKKDGASNGAVVSFLVSTPQTGVDSILATYSMMGVVMAIYRPIAAFFSGIITGGIVDIFAKKDKINSNTQSSCCCCSCDEEHSTCGCEEVHTSCSCESEHSNCGCEEVHTSCSCESKHSTCGCGCGCESATPTTKLGKFKRVFTYAYGGFLDEIAGHFMLGMLIATVISTFVPTDFFVSLGLDSGVLAMIAMIIIGLPMYICSTASIPIAITLAGKGLSFGASFAFLFTGPVTNIASILVLSKALGEKITTLYIASVSVCSVVFGLLLDFLIEKFDLAVLFTSASSTHSEEANIISYIVAVIFLALIIKSFIVMIKNKIK
ncbi:MAG: SO_0444 family Cu/Zn efflux transporter [Clostridia bacterium]